MEIQANSYNIERFLFTDSLINGGIKPLTGLINELIRRTEAQRMPSVKWQGQFIARPAREMGRDVYTDLRRAGCDFVSIGVESGSEKVGIT